MPNCKCIKPCNCHFTEDGLFFGNPSFGRHHTQVSGSGTTDNPFVISFADQLEYYPRTAEFQFEDISLGSAAGEGQLRELGDSEGATILYQSPISFLLIHDYQFGPDTQYPEIIRGSHFIVGASATFSDTANDPNGKFKQLVITSSLRGISDEDPVIEKIIAAQSVPNIGGDPKTLTATGMTPVSFYEPSGIKGIHHIIHVYVNQNSGSSVAVSNLKVWVTQI